jgi:hypothetical protein
MPNKRIRIIHDVIAFTLLAIPAFMIYSSVSRLAYNLYNTGCYVNIANMIMSRRSFYDPFWRLGMLANLNPLFPSMLALSSMLAGKTPWDAYPHVLTLVWSLLPFSVYYLTSRLTSWRGGLIAGIAALCPVNLPDQGPWILSMVFAPLLILCFLRLLERPTLKSGILFGLIASISFWSHMGTFIFFSLTFSILALMVLVVRVFQALREKGRGTSIKGCKGYLDAVRTSVSISASAVTFLLLNSPWLAETLNLYGSNAFNAPLIRLSREEAVLESWGFYCAYKEHPMAIFIALLCGVATIIFSAVRCLRKRCENWIAQAYFIIAGVVSFALLAPFQTFGIWLGPPNRYGVYLAFVCWVALGAFYEALLNEARRLLRSKANLVDISVVALLLLFLTYVMANYCADAISRGMIPSAFGMFYPPIKDSDAHVKAMKWLATVAKPSDVVAAEAPLSDRLRYFANVSTLSGFHYSTHIDPEKDKAVAIILYSDDFPKTIEMLKKYSVRYVYASTETIGTYEIMVRWSRIWKEKANIAKLYALLGEPIYEENGIFIFRVPEKTMMRSISLPLNVKVRNGTIFGEDFEDLNDWSLEGEGGRCDVFDGVLRLSLTSRGRGVEHVYLHTALPEGKYVFIGDSTILAVRYRLWPLSHIFAGPKLHIALCVNNTWFNIALWSENWTTSYIFLPKFGARGYLQALKLGIWGHNLPEGEYKLDVDFLTIAEASFLEA